VPPHIVRDIAGHSATEVTITIYAHMSMDEKRDALERLASLVSEIIAGKTQELQPAEAAAAPAE